MSLRPKSNEMVTQSLMIYESMTQYGYLCRMLVPTSVDLPEIGYQQDVGYDEDKAVELYALPVNGQIAPKLLKKLGWDIESTSDTKPFVIQVCRYMKDSDGKVREVLPTIYTRFTFDYSYDYDEKEFIATKVSGSMFNPLYYIVSLAPYRYNQVRDHEPLRDTNLEVLNVEETDERFRFMQLPRRGEEIATKYGGEGYEKFPINTDIR